MAVGTAVDEEAVGVNVTSTFTRGTLAGRGSTKTHGTVHMAEAEITGEGDTTNLQTTPTIPQLQPRAIRTGDTHHKAVIRTTNRVGTEDHLSHRTTRGLRINNPPMGVAEEGTLQDMMARMVAEGMGTVEGEAALLPREEVRHTAAEVGMAIKEVREGGTGTVAPVVDTTSPRRTVVTAEVVTMEVEVTNPVEAINPVEVISSPVDHTALVLSLTETKEDTTKGVEVVGEDTDYRHRRICKNAGQVFSVRAFLLL